MGCSNSKAEEEAKAEEAREKQRKRDAANAAMNAPKPDPKNFMLTQLKDQSIIREPGSINGQQFIIEECENCTIYLLDHTATVSIDECKNCRIFVGPCESSVFVRTSKNMKLIIAAQQLRTRECSDLDILLYVSAGQPVIESTSNVRLGCFQFNYFGLAAQFAAAGVDPWYSEWSNVHDFTASSGSRSWSYLDSSTKNTDLMPSIEDAKLVAQVGAQSSVESLAGFVTPNTWGNKPLPSSDLLPTLVAIAPGFHDSLGYPLFEETWKPWLDTQQVVLVRSRRIDFQKAGPQKDKFKSIFNSPEFEGKKQDKFLSAASSSGASSSAGKQLGANSVLGFEVHVAPAIQQEFHASIVKLLESNAGAVYVSEAGAKSKQPLELFFENMAVM